MLTFQNVRITGIGVRFSDLFTLFFVAFFAWIAAMLIIAVILFLPVLLLFGLFT